MVTPSFYGVPMGSDNPSGAVNQQERPSSAEWLDALPADLGNWVAGFVDGTSTVVVRSASSRVMLMGALVAQTPAVLQALLWRV